MKPSFSEFSYGYAVTEGIVRSTGPLKAAPLFPSLRSEGTKGGFDVKLGLPGLPLFLQFKLSDCMVGKAAQEAQQGLFTLPFYRMHIRRADRSRQHKLLLELERDSNAVYYIAPGFHLQEQFNRAYRHRSIPTDSVMIPPNQIGELPDDENHHIAFQDAQATSGYLLSEEWREVRISSWEEMIRGMTQRHRTQAERPLHELLPEMENQMLDIAESHFEEKHQPSRVKDFWSDEDPIIRVASLSQVFFNCTFFIIQHNPLDSIL